MTISVDDIDHSGKKVQMPGSSVYDDESQLDDYDDDRASENSFGSDFGDDATDEEDLTTDADIELTSPPPLYPDDEELQLGSTPMPPNMDLKSSPVSSMKHEYVPPRSTESKSSGSFSPSMCVVCKLAPAYSKGGVCYPTCGLTCASKMPNVPSSPSFFPEPEAPPQYAGIPSSASQSEMSYPARQGSVRKRESQIPPQYTGLPPLSTSQSELSYPAKRGSVRKRESQNLPRYTDISPSSASQSEVSYPARQGHEPQIILQYTGMPLAPSFASQNEISYSGRRGGGNRSRGGASHIAMCEVCHVRPRAQKAGKVYPTCGFTCAAVLNSQGNVPTLDPLISSYQQLSLSDHSSASQYSPQQPSRGHRHNSHVHHGSHGRGQSFRGSTITQSSHHRPSQVHNPCVICHVKPCRGRYVTCGMRCAVALCKRGSSNPKICDYCHRRPKVPGYNQCGKTCRDNASMACLLCRCRPKFGRYHLCGRTCKAIATKWTPLILEARPGHATYDEVEQRFKRAWKGNTACPPIKKIYKIIESKSFLLPYDRYKRQIGNEVFRYHGTKRSCSLGSQGNTRLCSSTGCALCSILRTSFKVSLASPSGAFGAGVYTSSAANKAYSYSNGGTGAIILTKVVLGTVYNVSAWNQVMSCPPGHNSVVFDRQNGMLNETIVYTDDAIRPVFLLIF